MLVGGFIEYGKSGKQDGDSPFTQRHIAASIKY
jgi:hypothetical protein